jgi:hypothetical protein
MATHNPYDYSKNGYSLRASFKPAAYLLGSSNRPSQIFIFGLTGGTERWLKIPLDTSQSPVTYTEQALAVVRKTPTVQFFGPTTGFIVNYTPDMRCVSTWRVDRSRLLPTLIDQERSHCISEVGKFPLKLWDAS